jgi:hypothetical protein
MSAPARRGKASPAPQRNDAKFLVLADRQDGGRRLFSVYPTKEEAEAVAAALRAVGCLATVEVEQACAR